MESSYADNSYNEYSYRLKIQTAKKELTAEELFRQQAVEKYRRMRLEDLKKRSARRLRSRSRPRVKHKDGFVARVKPKARPKTRPAAKAKTNPKVITIRPINYTITKQIDQIKTIGIENLERSRQGLIQELIQNIDYYCIIHESNKRFRQKGQCKRYVRARLMECERKVRGVYNRSLVWCLKSKLNLR